MPAADSPFGIGKCKRKQVVREGIAAECRLQICGQPFFRRRFDDNGQGSLPAAPPVRARRAPVRADKQGRRVRPSPHRAQPAGALAAHEPPETAAFAPFLPHLRTNVPYRPPCGAARQSRLPSRSAVCPDRVPSAAARAVCPPAERPALHRNLRPPSTRREPQAAGTVRRTRNRRLANALSADSLRQSRCAAHAHRGPRPAGAPQAGASRAGAGSGSIPRRACCSGYPKERQPVC